MHLQSLQQFSYSLSIIKRFYGITYRNRLLGSNFYFIVFISLQPDWKYIKTRTLGIRKKKKNIKSLIKSLKYAQRKSFLHFFLLFYFILGVHLYDHFSLFDILRLWFKVWLCPVRGRLALDSRRVSVEPDLPVGQGYDLDLFMELCSATRTQKLRRRKRQGISTLYFHRPNPYFLISISDLFSFLPG